MGFLGIIAHSVQMFYEAFSANEGLPFFVKETASSFFNQNKAAKKDIKRLYFD